MRACGLSHNALLCVTHRFCVDMDTTKHTIIDRGDASLAVFVCPTEYHRGRLLRRRSNVWVGNVCGGVWSTTPASREQVVFQRGWSGDLAHLVVQRVQRYWKTHTHRKLLACSNVLDNVIIHYVAR